MTLALALQMTADPTDLNAGVAEGEAAIDQFGAAAERAGAAAGAAATGMGASGDAAKKAAAAAAGLSTGLTGVAAAAKLSFVQMEILKSGAINTLQSIAAGLPLMTTLETQLLQTAPALPAAFSAASGAVGRFVAYLGTAQGALVGLGIGAAVAALAALTAEYISARDAAEKYADNQKKIEDGLKDLASNAKDLVTQLEKLTPVEREAFSLRQVEDQAAALENVSAKARDIGDAIGKALDKLYEFQGAASIPTRLSVQLDLSGLPEAGNGIPIVRPEVPAGLIGETLPQTPSTVGTLRDQLAGLANAGDLAGVRTLLDSWSTVIDKTPGLRKELILLTAEAAENARKADELGRRWALANAELYRADPTNRALVATLREMGDAVDHVVSRLELLGGGVLDRARLGLGRVADRGQLWLQRNWPAEGDLSQFAQADSKNETQRGTGQGPNVEGIRQEAEAAAADARSWLSVADAYLRSAAAGQVAEAQRQATQDAITQGVDATARARQILDGQVAQSIAQGAKQASDLIGQADAQKLVNDRVTAGTLAYSDAARALQVENALRPLTILQSITEGTVQEQLTQVINTLRESYGRLHAEQTRSAAQGIIANDNDRIAQTRAEIAALGQGEVARTRTMALLQAEQQIRSNGIDTMSAEAAQIRANATAQADLTLELARQQAAYSTLSTFGQQSLENLNNAIMKNGLSWKTLGDVVTSIAAEMITTLEKLAVLNPISNSLFGGNAPTLFDVGGLLGSLLGNSASTAAVAAATSASGTGYLYHSGGMVGWPANDTRVVSLDVYRNAPRLHDGGILPGEQPAILRHGEGVFTPEQMANANALFAAAMQPSPVNVQIINNAGVQVRQQSRRNGNGSLDLQVILDQQQAGSIRDTSSGSAAALRDTWDAQPSLIRR